MSDGRLANGKAGVETGRGGGQGSGVGARGGSGGVLAGFSIGVPVFTGSALSIRFGVPSSFAFASSFAPDFGPDDSFGSGVGLLFELPFPVDSKDLAESAFAPFFSFEAAASPSSVDFFAPDFDFALGVADSSGSGVGVFLAVFFVPVPDFFDPIFFFFFDGVGLLPFSLDFFALDSVFCFGEASGFGVGVFLGPGVEAGSWNSSPSLPVT